MVAANKNNRSIRRPQPQPTLAWLGLNQAASLRLLTLLGLVLVSGVSVVYLTHKDRVLFNELQVLLDQANDLDVQWGQLLIEENLWAFPHRIEKDATKLLSMRAPKPKEIEFVGLESQDGGVNHASR